MTVYNAYTTCYWNKNDVMDLKWLCPAGDIRNWNVCAYTPMTWECPGSLDSMRMSESSENYTAFPGLSVKEIIYIWHVRTHYGFSSMGD